MGRWQKVRNLKAPIQDTSLIWWNNGKSFHVNWLIQEEKDRVSGGTGWRATVVKIKKSRWIMVRLTLSQKAWVIGIVMAGLFLAVNLVFVLIGYSTNSPSECKTCHSGSYKLWKENKAHRESITCTFCHSSHSSSQFAYAASRFSNMPKALDQDCIKCHKNYMEEKKKKILVFAEQLDEEEG